MSIEEHEKEEGAYLEYEHPEPGVIPEEPETFTGGDLHINYNEEQEGKGIDEERLSEELNEL